MTGDLTAAVPVTEGLMQLAMADSVLQAIIDGRVSSNSKQDPVFPYSWLEVVTEDDSLRGLGTGGLATVYVRVHTYARLDSITQAQTVNRRFVTLYKDELLPDVPASGYKQAGRIVYVRTVAVVDELDGERVNEVVSYFTVFMDQL